MRPVLNVKLNCLSNTSQGKIVNKQLLSTPEA